MINMKGGEGCRNSEKGVEYMAWLFEYGSVSSSSCAMICCGKGMCVGGRWRRW